MTLKHTRIEVSNAVFSLPYHVAKEEGYFAEEGFDVELVPAGSGRDRDKEVPDKPVEDHRAVKSYGWHEGIEKGEFCMYRACEWGQIRRTQDSAANAKVISKRSAVATQAIVVRADSPYNVPADLRGRTVAVNFHAGSHYITLAHAGRIDERQGRRARRPRRRPQAAPALPRGRQSRGCRRDGAVDHGRGEERAQDHQRSFLRRRRSRHARRRSADVRRHHARDQPGRDEDQPATSGLISNT